MITQTLNDIVRLLTKSKIGYMVMGAQAVIVYGKPRLKNKGTATIFQENCGFSQHFWFSVA